jgi:hypothetical protein
MDSSEWEKGVCGVGVMFFFDKITEGVLFNSEKYPLSIFSKMNA